MLQDVQLVDPDDPFLGKLLFLLADEKKTERLSQGIYLCGHFNFEMEFRDPEADNFELNHPNFESADGEYFGCYGVCDSPEQLSAKLPDEVTKGGTPYVISLVRLDKSTQPAEGGWRWHKWGQYIGEQKQTTEYLYDEPEVETVYTYHIYQIR